MSNPAAFSGDYTDLRFVKTRSVCQVVIEIDISQASSFVAAFGAPMPGTGVPVAIARLDLETAATEPPKAIAAPPKERRSWSALSYAEQAGIRCGEPDFWRFLNELDRDDFVVRSSEDAARFVRTECGVKSRADLIPGSFAGGEWMNLNDKYDSWLRRSF